MKRTLPQASRANLRRFGRREDGGINVEAMLWFPLMIGLIAVSLVFFDAFRKYSLAQKAAYTVGDMISRETTAIGPDYVANARQLVATMSQVDLSDVTLRVTQVSYRKRHDDYRRNWSHRAGSHGSALTHTDVNNLSDELPVMSGGERVILVDITVSHEWPINVGQDNLNMSQRVFTRPRFAPKVAWNSQY